MNIHVLRKNAVRAQDKLGKIRNTKLNLNYVHDLESWGSLEIISTGDVYIEYRLI